MLYHNSTIHDYSSYVKSLSHRKPTDVSAHVLYMRFTAVFPEHNIWKEIVNWKIINRSLVLVCGQSFIFWLLLVDHFQPQMDGFKNLKHTAMQFLFTLWVIMTHFL